MKTGKMRLAVMISGLMLLILSPTALAAPQGVFKQAMHWGLSAEYLDPGTNMGATTSQILLYLFHDALVKPMPSGNYAPCLAESYTISPDAKTYEFKLRRGVKFHNEDPMTAEDEGRNFRRNGVLPHDQRAPAIPLGRRLLRQLSGYPGHLGPIQEGDRSQDQKRLDRPGSEDVLRKEDVTPPHIPQLADRGRP